ncbi:hypothetical protein ABT144_14420 [Streptomyces sp. NPDC002039]|uniref:hypothetical protein n=1 Tax=Streptomyces sp. NPDC002039 TaxID=3154660 RepID=UPI00331CAE9E
MGAALGLADLLGHVAGASQRETPRSDPARDPNLDRHVRDVEERAALSADPDRAKAFLEEAARIHNRVSRLGPGE